MEFLDLPPYVETQIFDTITERMHGQSQRLRFAAERSALRGQAVSYLTHGNARSLPQLAQPAYEPANVTNEDLQDLFERLKKNTRPRRLYDELIARSQMSRCPYCSDRPPSTLDHYLGKSAFAAFTVLGTNLVPACPECNNAKGAYESSNAGTIGATLHPYFDNVSNVRWLRARINDVRGRPVARFFVDGAGIPTIDLRHRAATHLKALNLKKYFKIKAGQEIGGLNQRLAPLLATDGRNAVENELHKQADQRSRNRLNSWERALFEALAEDSWYLDVYLPTVPLDTPITPRAPIAL